MTTRARVIRAMAIVLCCSPFAACGGAGGRAAAPVTPLAGRPAAPPPPRRPALPAGADTCDPDAYYDFGRTQLRDHPAAAAAAYYWMQRLSPGTPNAYYSERVALLLADRPTLRGYFNDEPHTLALPKVRRIDSLEVRAIELDPFFPQYLEEHLIVAYYTFVILNDIRSQASSSNGVREEDVEDYVRTHVEDEVDPATRAWLQYARGDYLDAVAYWGSELRRDSTDSHLRARRAKALFLAGAYDSARAELQAALGAARRSDARQMKYVYDSKELWEYELGWIDELQKRDSSAREHYQAALVENLSFAPAHLRLAIVALRARDTTGALTELGRATEIRDDDYASHVLLGTLLAARRDFPGATAQLRRAAEIEPWTAWPHFLLGNTRLDAGDREGAAAEFTRYLALASRTDPNVERARRRLADLPRAPVP